MNENIYNMFMGAHQQQHQHQQLEQLNAGEGVIKALYHCRNEQHFSEFLFEIFLYEIASSIPSNKTTLFIRFDTLQYSANLAQSYMSSYGDEIDDPETGRVKLYDLFIATAPYALSPEDVYLYLKDEWRVSRLFTKEIVMDYTKTIPSQFPISCSVSRLSQQDHDHFQRTYAKIKPEFQDRYAAIVHGCRKYVWRNQGSGGNSIKPNGILSVEKYTSKYNQELREKWSNEDARAANGEEGPESTTKKKNKRAKNKSTGDATKNIENGLVTPRNINISPPVTSTNNNASTQELSTSTLVYTSSSPSTSISTAATATLTMPSLPKLPPMDESLEEDLIDRMTYCDNLENRAAFTRDQTILMDILMELAAEHHAVKNLAAKHFNAAEARRLILLERARHLAIFAAKQRDGKELQLEVRLKNVIQQSLEINVRLDLIKNAVKVARAEAIQIKKKKNAAKKPNQGSQSTDEANNKPVTGRPTAEQIKNAVVMFKELDYFLDEYTRLKSSTVSSIPYKNPESRVIPPAVLAEARRDAKIVIMSQWNPSLPLRPALTRFLDDSVKYKMLSPEAASKLLKFHDETPIEEKKDRPLLGGTLLTDTWIRSTSDAGWGEEIDVDDLDQYYAYDSEGNPIDYGYSDDYYDLDYDDSDNSFYYGSDSNSTNDSPALLDSDGKKIYESEDEKVPALLDSDGDEIPALLDSDDKKIHDSDHEKIPALIDSDDDDIPALINKGNKRIPTQLNKENKKIPTLFDKVNEKIPAPFDSDDDEIPALLDKNDENIPVLYDSDDDGIPDLLDVDKDNIPTTETTIDEGLDETNLSEAKRVAEEQSERAWKIAKEDEAKRVANEEEAKRVAKEEEAKRVAKEEEAKRVAKEEEAKRVAKVEEAKRVAKEEEAKRVAKEEEAKRVAKEEEAKRTASEEEAKRVAKVEEAKRVAKEEEAKRVAKQEEAKRVAKEEDNIINIITKKLDAASIRSNEGENERRLKSLLFQIQEARNMESSICHRKADIEASLAIAEEELQIQNRVDKFKADRGEEIRLMRSKATESAQKLEYEVVREGFKSHQDFMNETHERQQIEDRMQRYVNGRHSEIARMSNEFDIIDNTKEIHRQNLKKKVESLAKEEKLWRKNREDAEKAYNNIVEKIAAEKPKLEELQQRAAAQEGVEEEKSSIMEPTRLQNDNEVTFDWQGINLTLPMWEPPRNKFGAMDTQVTNMYHRLLPTPESINLRLGLLQRLQQIFDEEFPGEGLELKPFGSFITGLGDEHSDLDLCVYCKEYQPYNARYSIPSIAGLLTRYSMQDVVPITNAKVPIVKFKDPSTGIACDMNVHYPLGIYNSQLIRAYLDIDARLGRFLFILKHFAKCHGILDASVGFLSSYAYTIMAIVFFQEQKDGCILPRLQAKTAQPRDYNEKGKRRNRAITFANAIADGTVQPIRDYQEGKSYDCSFDTRIALYKSYGLRINKSVATLLFEFFQYYTRKFDYRTMEVSALNGRVQERFSLSKEKKQQLAREKLSISFAENLSSPTFDSKRNIWLSASEKAYFKDLNDNGGVPSGSVPIPGTSPATTLAIETSEKTLSLFGTEAFLCVMDPFVQGRNVAASCRGERLVKVWKCFDYAYKCMALGKFEEIFTPMESSNML